MKYDQFGNIILSEVTFEEAVAKTANSPEARYVPDKQHIVVNSHGGPEYITGALIAPWYEGGIVLKYQYPAYLLRWFNAQ